MARTFSRNIWETPSFNRDYETFDMVVGSRSLNMYVYRQRNPRGEEIFELTRGYYWRNPDGSTVVRYPLDKRGDIFEGLWHLVHGSLEDCKKKLCTEAFNRYDRGTPQELVNFINKIKELQ